MFLLNTPRYVCGSPALRPDHALLFQSVATVCRSSAPFHGSVRVGKFLPATAGLCGRCYIFGKSCEEILSIDDWLAKAPPKQGSRRGRDYRSRDGTGKVLVRTAQCRAARIVANLATIPGRRGDSHRRKSRGIVRTIISVASTGITTLPGWALHHQKLAIAIEAKADELFGNLNRSGPNLPARIDGLSWPAFNTISATTEAALNSAKQHGAVAIFLVLS